MRLRLLHPLLLTLSVTVTSTAAYACTIAWESQAETEQSAEVVVTAVILAVLPPKSSFRGTDFFYRLRIETTERGELERGERELYFEDLLMHRRGDMTVCPIKHGSGIEGKLAPGSKYRLYLRSKDNLEIMLARRID